ncbi:MAG: ATP-binding protein [Pseudohongiellaceae bacterium]
MFIGPPGVGKTHLANYDVLVIEELGYLPMTRQARYNLFQLINSLYEYHSIILTTNKDFTNWGEFFHDDGALCVNLILYNYRRGNIDGVREFRSSG